MYHIHPEGYLSPSNFAKIYYQSRKNRQGVSRKYMYDLIEQERMRPGSTGLDILEVDGKAFCRYAKGSMMSVALSTP